MIWFSVRCLFLIDRGLYEERIVVLKAANLDHAIEMAELDALEYSENIDCKYLGLAQAYEIGEFLEEGSEVFSLMRESTLEPNQYLSAFFDSGLEKQQ